MKVENLRFGDRIMVYWRYPTNIDIPSKFEAKFIGRIDLYQDYIILGPKNPKVDKHWDDIPRYSTIIKMVPKIDLYQYSAYVTYPEEIVEKL